MSADANVNETSKSVDVMMIIRFILSFIGIIGNLTVLIVFLNHSKFRKKDSKYLYYQSGKLCQYSFYV